MTEVPDPAQTEGDPLVTAAASPRARMGRGGAPRSPVLPDPILPSREQTRMHQAARGRIPTWAVVIGAAFLGVLAFVLVLFALSRLSRAPGRPITSIAGENHP
jgi:hypothetical protein